MEYLVEISCRNLLAEFLRKMSRQNFFAKLLGEIGKISWLKGISRNYLVKISCRKLLWKLLGEICWVNLFTKFVWGICWGNSIGKFVAGIYWEI